MISPVASTLGELLASGAQVGTGGLRFVDRRERARFVSWSQVERRAAAAAGALRSQGVEPGECVAIVLRTSPRFFDAFFGTLLAGAVPVPLYPPVRLGRLAEYHQVTAAMLAAVRARRLVSEPTVARLLGDTVDACDPHVDLIVLEDPPRVLSKPTIRSPRSDDLALVQFSSGTTVEPKPVALSHRAILAQVRTLNDHWRDLAGASGVSWLPLYHDMGLIGCVFPALELAAELTLIAPETFIHRPAIWLRTLSRYRGTVSPAPNFAYGLCLEKIRDDELEGVDLSPWRIALNGAEPVSAEVMRRFNRRFAGWGLAPEVLAPVYGLSEASLAVTFSDLETPFTSARFDRRELAMSGRAVADSDGRELVSVGKALPGFEIEIRGGHGGALTDRCVGRVWVRGPSLMDGYLNRPRATAEALVDGWLDTGDRAFLDRGELYLVGRDKDILIVRGRNHAPEEIERAIDGVEGIRTGCAAAVSYRPEGAAAEALLLFVERRPGRRSRSELAATCHGEVLARTGLALDHVEVLSPGTLPRTSSGKIRRREALARYRAGELEPPRRFHLGHYLLSMIPSRRQRHRRRTAS